MTARAARAIGIILFAALIVWSAACTGVSPELFARGCSGMAELAAAMLPPEAGYLPVALAALVSTLRMAFLGTLFGAILAQFGVAAADGFVNRTGILRNAFRLVIHVIRCTPVLISALLLTFIFGLGEWTGTLAVTLSTFAILTRIGFEDAANARLDAALALEATGAGRLKAWLRTVRIATRPSFLANALYLLESNTRQAAVLGFVGAGGIGLILNETLAWRAYTRTGCILMALFALVAAVEWLSEHLQGALAGRVQLRHKPFWIGTFLAAAAACLASLPAPDTAHWNLEGASAIVLGLLAPDTDLLVSGAEDAVPAMLLETAQIALLGTCAGTLLAGVFAFTASFRIFGRWALAGRTLLLAIRSVPVLVYGLLWIRVTGPGPAAGVLTLTLCSIGLLSKRFLVAIDAIDAAPYEALKASGASTTSAVIRAIVPQLTPHFISAVIYRFDINLRDTAALGLVGAGGIGTPLVLAMRQYEWQAAGAMLLALIAAVGIVGWAAAEFNRRWVKARRPGNAG